MVRTIPDPCRILRVQSWDLKAVLPPGIEPLLGVTWPRVTGVVETGRADVLCVGPTDWLTITSGTMDSQLLLNVDGALQGSTFRATDVSCALARIEIQGPHSRRLLSKACALDVHSSKFPPGRVARTRFAGVPVVVRCKHDTEFECIVARSHHDYLLAWLHDAAAELSP